VPGPGRGEGYGLQGLVKSLDLPAGYTPPTELAYEDIKARAISRADLDDDVRGINASLEIIHGLVVAAGRRRRSVRNFNFVDLVLAELEFREGYSFTYAVVRLRQPLPRMLLLLSYGKAYPAHRKLLEYDVDVSWWVNARCLSSRLLRETLYRATALGRPMPSPLRRHTIPI